MAKKQDYILNYIKHLETGTKISIRSLADTLSVSEGTAYKAIKKAEELNMVHTRPRAGTVRIADETQPEKKRFSLRKLIHQLSLSIITGKENDEPIETILAQGHTPENVERVVRLIRINEYKRRQAPVGPRLSPRSFGKDWRCPITNGFRR